MTNNEFDNYLTLVGKLLRLRGKQREQIAGELRSHLEERLDELLSQGVPRERAVTMALEEFGDAAVLAADFVSLSRNRKRRWLMRAMTFSVAAMVLLAAGIAIFWPSRNAAPGVATAVAQDPAATPTEADPESPVTKSPATDELTVEDKLNARINTDFVETSLSDVFSVLSEQADIQFYVKAKKLEEAGVALDVAITRSFKQIRLSTFLDLILDELELTYVIKDDLVLITTPEDAESKLEIRVYDCRDLLALSSQSGNAALRNKAEAISPTTCVPALPASRIPIIGTPTVPPPQTRFPDSIMPQFGGAGLAPGVEAGGSKSKGQLGGSMEEPVHDELRRDYDSLIELITTNVDPHTWDDIGGPGTISAYHGLIVVTQTPQTHQKVERVLDMLREAAGLEVPGTGKVVR